MHLNPIVLLISLFVFITTSAQVDYEYIGAIKLSDTSYISYKITFSEDNGFLKGYSVTDIGGAHETMSNLTGSFDAEKDEIEFYESDILYTKSYITQNDFCYIHFTGSLKKLDDRQGIEGSFEGLYDNGERCIDGTINLVNFRKVLKRAKRLDRKIDRTILISKEKRDKVNLVKELESTKTNVLNKNEILSVFTENNEITLRLFDAGQEDGDKVSLRLNDLLILDEYVVSNAPKEIEIPLQVDESVIQLQALNNGSIGGNTVKLEIVLDQNTVIDALTNLNSGETTSLIIRKR